MNDADLVREALAGQRRALSRLLSRVENGEESADAILKDLYSRSGQAHLIGITGAPGTGKSTLVSRVAQELRRRGSQVAIVAVDPSSPFSGGALLGDRIRMAGLSGDPGVFVRSMASRGAAGGLAEQTGAAVVVLAGVGFDVVLIETVGVGQDELEVAQEAHTTVLVTAPGLGDDVQALKAGILEIADILVVNKADRDGADRLVAELTFATALGEDVQGGTQQAQTYASVAEAAMHAGAAAESRPARAAGGWKTPVLRTAATAGAGVTELVDTMASHRAWLERSGVIETRARALAERHILRWAAAKALRDTTRRARASGLLQQLVEQVAARRLSPPEAANELLRMKVDEKR